MFVKLTSATLTLFLCASLVACSDESDTPPFPPAISAAGLEVVDIYDNTTDLSRIFQKDRNYGVPTSYFKQIKTLGYLISPQLRSELTRRAEAGDADAQFELVFLGGSPDIAKLETMEAGSIPLDPCSANHWLNKAAQQKYAPALVWMTNVFLTGGELKQDRRLASFHFWTWSKLKGFDIKNYTAGSKHPLLAEDEFKLWSEEFKSWDIATAVSLEPRYCPACKANCLTMTEN